MGQEEFLLQLFHSPEGHQGKLPGCQVRLITISHTIICVYRRQINKLLNRRMSVLLDAHFDVGLYLKEIFVPR